MPSRENKTSCFSPAFAAACCCALVLFIASCSRGPAVRIQVDFSTRQAWNYALVIQVTGRGEPWDSLRNFSSSARGILTGTPGSAPGTLRFTVMDPRIESDVLPAAELENIRQRVAATVMVLSLNNGTIITGDTAAMPAVYLSGWDIYRTIARMLPSVPDHAIKPGYTWDRERTVPLATVMGNTSAHLYQSFTFDSYAAQESGPSLARISWRFSYRVDKPAGDTSGASAAIPLSGSGQGYALFDVRGRILSKAHVSFTVPRQGTGLEWNEEVTMQLSD